MLLLDLPNDDGTIAPYRAMARPVSAPTGRRFTRRIAYAAAHVVADPRRTADPWGAAAIDWDATMAFRRHLWSLGFRIAEAMDTAQRGMGLSWENARGLIRRSMSEARTIAGADLACGAGTDHLEPGDVRSIDDIIRAYEDQLDYVERHGGRAIIMASRALARIATTPDDYVKVYGRILGGLRQKAILHWLGPMFDAALEGYWGRANLISARDTVIDIISQNASKVEGIKVSLLDSEHEIALRRRLPAGVVMFTGDDFNYPALIAGDARGHSHALLGIFDPIAPVASLAFGELDAGDLAAFRRLLDPTVPLARRIFEAPTQYYKTGVVFLAWLNGHQDHFTMLAGMQSARGIAHFADVYRLADGCGLIADPELAHARFRALLQTHGIAQA